MRRLVIGLLAVTLIGCSPKEDVDTSPAYLSDTRITFDVYDDVVTLELDSDEALKVLSDDSATLVNTNTGTEISISYVQGNSLNDYVSAYYDALNDDTKSDLEDNTFTTDTTYYGFRVGDQNDYVLVKGPKKQSKYCQEVLDRFEVGGVN